MERVKPVLAWVSDYWLWLCIGVLLLGIGTVQRLRHLRKEMNKREVIVEDITMTIEGRRMYVHKVMLQKICDAALDAVLSGELTTQEMNDELGKLAKVYDKSALENLIRERKAPALKAELRNKNRRRQVRNEKTVPVPIPEPKRVAKAPVDPDSLAAIIGS